MIAFSGKTWHSFSNCQLSISSQNKSLRDFDREKLERLRNSVSMTNIFMPISGP